MAWFYYEYYDDTFRWPLTFLASVVNYRHWRVEKTLHVIANIIVTLTYCVDSTAVENLELRISINEPFEWSISVVPL